MNFTEDLNNTTNQEFYCTTGLNKLHLKIIISTLNVFLSITAFLGNLLITVALQKVSSLHPPSKLLLCCLASTDLCVGLITQPLYVIFILSPEHTQRCFYVGTLLNFMGVIFCGVSLLTLTAISVDRLLALLLGLRYKQVVTLKRVWFNIVVFWLFSTGSAVLSLHSFQIAARIGSILLIFCAATSIFCYTKIYSSLRHHHVSVGQIQQEQPSRERFLLNIARYRKTVSSVLWVQLTLVACYLPHIIVVTMFAISGSASSSLALTWAVTLSLVYVNSSLNPFLYCWKMREVRQAVKNTINQFWQFSS